MEIPGDALTQADNVEYMVSGGIRGRRGITGYNASALGGSVSSIWRHYPRTGSPTLIVAVDTGAAIAFYAGNDGAGTFAAITGGGGLTTGKLWSFATWPAKNKTFMVDGVNAKTYDGSTIAGGPGAMKLGPYVTVHKNRLWATDPNELTYSVYASDVDDETIWGAQISCNDNQGGVITGVHSYQGALITMKSTGLWRFLGDPSTASELTNYSHRGNVAPRSAQVTPFGIIYVGLDGVYLTDAQAENPLDLSIPIKPLFVSRGANVVYSSAVGIWNQSKNQYYLKLDPASTDLYVLSRVEFLGTQAPAWVWSKFTGVAGICGVAWGAGSDVGQVVLGRSDGYVDYLNSGVNDKGASYTSAITTSRRLIDASRRTGRAYRVRALYRATGQMTGEILYDNNGTGISFSV